MDNSAFDQCMAKIRQGDKDALKEIYDAYLDTLYYQILSLVGNEEDAKDLTSELFIKLWTIADTYRPGNGHKRWLATLAHHLCIDFLRKKGREIQTEPEKLEELEVGILDPQIEALSEQDFLAHALSLLTQGQREVVHLKVVGELTLKEISKVLGVPMGTVAWRYRQGIHKLRRCGYVSGF